MCVCVGGPVVQAGRLGNGWADGMCLCVYVDEMVSSEANHSNTNAEKERGLASLVEVPASPEKQESSRGEEEGKKREDG